METVVHDKIICPMCEQPIRTEGRLRKGGLFTVSAGCDCPNAGTSFTFSSLVEAHSYPHEATAKKLQAERANFRNGFDAAMHNVRRFAEQHLPTAADPGVN